MKYTDILQIIASNLIWQSILISCVVFFTLKTLPRSQVKIRYEVALTGLIGTAFLMAAPFIPKLLPNLSVGIAPPVQEILPHIPSISTPNVTEITTNSGVAEIIVSQPTLSLPIGFLLTIIWILGSAIMFGNLILAARKGAAWRDAATPTAASGSTLLSRPVDILRSEHINAPLVLGLNKPVILVPKKYSLDLNKPETRAVLEHEIAHITRYDLRTNFAQRLVLALLWWCIPLYWINAQIGAEREKLCDDVAAQKVNDEPHNGRALARALLDLAEAQINNRTPLLAIGVHPKAGLLAERVQRLCNTNSIPKLSKKVLLSTSLAIPFMLITLTALTPRAYANDPSQEIPSKSEQARDWIGDMVKTARVTDIQKSLYGSVEKGDHRTVQTLLENGVHPDFVLHGDGTPLLAAVRKNDKPMIAILLAAKADVNLAARGDGNPLIHAAMRGHVDTAKLLVKHGADVNARVSGDETPLINASRRGHLDMVQYLVEQGADVNLGMWSSHSISRKWRTPLGEAKKHKRHDIVKYLSANNARYETRTYDPVSNNQHSEVTTHNPQNSVSNQNTSIKIVQGRVTSVFGVNRKGKKHRGIDIANKIGTPIYASDDGRITLTATEFSFRENYSKTDKYGKTLELETAGGVKTIFAHLQGFNVELSDTVNAGDIIAYMGNTGASTGPHVHIETKINGNLINPNHVWPNLEL